MYIVTSIGLGLEDNRDMTDDSMTVGEFIKVLEILPSTYQVFVFAEDCELVGPPSIAIIREPGGLVQNYSRHPEVRFPYVALY